MHIDFQRFRIRIFNCYGANTTPHFTFSPFKTLRSQLSLRYVDNSEKPAKGVWPAKGGGWDFFFRAARRDCRLFGSQRRGQEHYHEDDHRLPATRWRQRQRERH